MSKPREPGTCKHCQTPYLKYRPWQEYCDPICQQRWHAAKRVESRKALEARVAELEQQLGAQQQPKD